VTIMKNLLIKLVFCFCVVNFTFAADPRPDGREYNIAYLEKNLKLERIYNRSRDWTWPEDSVEIGKLVEEGADPDTQGGTGMRPLIVSAYLRNDLLLAKVLLQAHANPNVINPKDHKPPLFLAQTVEGFDLLMAHGADYRHELRYSDENILYNAVQEDRDPALIVRYCNLGLNPTGIKWKYNSHIPLHRLFSRVKHSDPEIVEKTMKILLLAGADLNCIEEKHRLFVNLYPSPLKVFSEENPELAARIIAFNARVPAIKAARVKRVSDLLTACLKTENLNKIFFEYAPLSSSWLPLSLAEVEKL